MSMNVKATERLFKVGGDGVKGTYRYVMQAQLYNRLGADKVIEEAVKHSGMSEGVLESAWKAIGDVICAWATEGHSVAVPGLGTMRFGVRSKSVADVKDVSASLITSRRVIFVPSVKIKNYLKQTGISITCYDRDGNLVKQVLSNDDADIEDNENTGNDNQGTDTGGNTGNGGNTGGNGDNTNPPTDDNPDGIE